MTNKQLMNLATTAIRLVSKKPNSYKVEFNTSHSDVRPFITIWRYYWDNDIIINSAHLTIYECHDYDILLNDLKEFINAN